MATTLFKAISAIGLKTTAFLQSLFLSPLDAFLQAVKRFSITGPPNQPTLPCSTSSTSGDFHIVAADHDHDNSDNNDPDMTAAPTSSAAAPAPRDATASVPKIVPALPRVPAVAKKDACCPPTTDGTQLTDGLSRLDINGTGIVNENGIAKELVRNGASSGLDGGCCGTAATTTTMELDGETVQIQAKVETPEQVAEKAMHSRFMREALDMARLALRTNETPVGCVLVYKGRVIAKGMNATNVSRNGTRHAELMALSALLSYSPDSDLETAKSKSPENATEAQMPLGDKTNEAQPAETSTWGDVDPSDGHLYPYGQKLHPSPRVDPSVITECTLYVTVEPCVMCASLLRQFKIKKVYFGAVNDKFGGTGGVFRVHMNSPHSMASAPASPAPQVGKGLAKPASEPRPASADGTSNPQAAMAAIKDPNDVFTPVEVTDLPGDGGNVERGYEAEGGWGRDEAVTLLRQFYVQENNRAPVPRKKEGRAARLAAMMERDGQPGQTGATTTQASQDKTDLGAPENQSPTVGDAPEAATVAA